MLPTEPERLDELVSSYTERGQAEQLHAPLRQLGAALAVQGRFARAVDEYRRAIAVEPSAADNIDLQLEIARLQGKLGRSDALRVELRRISDQYGVGSPWASGQLDAAESYARVAAPLRAVAVERHYAAIAFERAGRPDATQEFEVARAAYEVYFAFAPGTPYERTAYAAVLMRLGDLDEAQRQYARAVELDPQWVGSAGAAAAAIDVARRGVASGSGDWSGRLVEACNLYFALGVKVPKDVRAACKVQVR